VANIAGGERGVAVNAGQNRATDPRRVARLQIDLRHCHSICRRHVLPNNGGLVSIRKINETGCIGRRGY